MKEPLGIQKVIFWVKGNLDDHPNFLNWITAESYKGSKLSLICFTLQVSMDSYPILKICL